MSLSVGCQARLEGAPWWEGVWELAISQQRFPDCSFPCGYVIEPMLWGAGAAQINLLKLQVIRFKYLKYIKSNPCRTI